mmetsp:Transcript_40925/g.36294  ORF Transcript_40925/g.36294 Transcript_40925/m.36294 type:complete len:138 (-) Transcript_40925:673-1086(-)
MAEKDIQVEEAYEIYLNAKDEVKAQLKQSRVGKHFQAEEPNLQEKPKDRSCITKRIKEVWNPDFLKGYDLDEAIDLFEKSLMDPIDNQEKCLKLLVRADMDARRVSDNLKKNRNVYRQYFGIERSPEPKVRRRKIRR